MNELMVCPNCGVEFQRKHHSQVHCTRLCAKQFSSKEAWKRESSKPKVANVGTCEVCGREYDKKQGPQKYCSERCSGKADAERKKLSRDRYRFENPLTCPICGTVFVITDSRQRFCSKKCTQRFNNIGKKTNPIHKDRRMKRMLENGKVDTSITLKELSDRFNGKCAICRKKVDWNNFEARNGVFIAGESYPSIDHIVAIANGGTHTWSNVQLAHRRCNNAKGAHEAYATTNGQFKLAI